MACDCCEGKPSGIMFCEDDTVNILEIGPPPTSGGPWAVGYDPAVPGWVYVNVGGIQNGGGEGFFGRLVRMFRKKAP